MKKKVIAGVMSIVIMMAMAIPAFAEESQQTMVTYTAQSTYTLSIPREITLETGEEKSLDIDALEVNIDPEREVAVKVSGDITDGGVILKRQEDPKESTTITQASFGSERVPINENAVVATFRDQNPQATTGGTLYFARIDENLKAGNWVGTITFSAEIVQR